ncbi:MAG TPA: hypothetical protein VFP28_00855 [Gemmatimonadales bacterium]|nr:hypothetical protein [Gemmatimonadales bacterium]
MSRRTAGLLVAVAHAALVGSLGLKLLADRARLPHGWARTQPFDPSAPLRGRYVRLGLEIPLASLDTTRGPYAESGVRLEVRGNRIVGAIDDSVTSPRVQLRRDADRWSARLSQPVAFFIPEHVPDPSFRPAGEELWAEVTVPRRGPPRPIRLGVMRGGQLTPLELR